MVMKYKAYKAKANFTTTGTSATFRPNLEAQLWQLTFKNDGTAQCTCIVYVIDEDDHEVEMYTGAIDAGEHVSPDDLIMCAESLKVSFTQGSGTVNTTVKVTAGPYYSFSGAGDFATVTPA